MKNLLVHDVSDILMHSVVIAPFVWLDMKGNLQKRPRKWLFSSHWYCFLCTLTSQKTLGPL